MSGDLAELAHPDAGTAAMTVLAAPTPPVATPAPVMAEPVPQAPAAPVPATAAMPAEATAPAPATDDLACQFERHAERARRQEAIRGWGAWFILAMILACAVIIIEPRSGRLIPAFASALVCVLSVAGGLVNEMHRAEFDRHRQAMQDCKAALLALGTPAGSAARWQQIDREPVFSASYMSFSPLCGPVFMLTFVLGLISLLTTGAAP